MPFHTSRGRTARTSFIVAFVSVKTAFLRTKPRPMSGRAQIRRKFRKNGFSLPFRSQSVEKLVENYQQPKIKSIWLT
jgi:hypothetical protein